MCPEESKANPVSKTIVLIKYLILSGFTVWGWSSNAYGIADVNISKVNCYHKVIIMGGYTHSLPFLCDELAFVSDIPHCCQADGVGRCTECPKEANISLTRSLCMCVCLHESIYHYLSIVISYSEATDLIVFLNRIMAVLET